MGQYLEDFKAGNLDLMTVDWNTIPQEDQDGIMALITAGGDFGVGGDVVQVPVKPDPVKSHGRGVANVVKYGAILGLVAGIVAVVVYFL